MELDNYHLIQTSFSLEDLKQSMKYVRNMQGIPVIEQELTTEEQRLDKFLAMRDLRDFLLSA